MCFTVLKLQPYFYCIGIRNTSGLLVGVLDLFGDFESDGCPFCRDVLRSVSDRTLVRVNSDPNEWRAAQVEPFLGIEPV